VRLDGARLTLRDFLATDLAAYIALRSDPKFQRFYSEADVSPQQSAALLERFIAQRDEVPRSKYQFAIESINGRLMGSCGVRLETPGCASVGCELGRVWHGRGAAREATAMVIAFGFKQWPLERIYAETISENTAAIRLCRSVGMRIESTRMGDKTFKGRQWDTVVLAMDRSTWRQMNEALLD
jgi:[ribosomal protein S5]-alanine N-acetyltransferase